MSWFATTPGSIVSFIIWILERVQQSLERLPLIEESTRKVFILGDLRAQRGGVLIMAHDACRAMKADTYIGDYCFLGARCIIMPGVKIGNEVVIGSGAVVTKDVPSNCIVAGNPAKVIRENIHCGKMGVLIKELK